MNWIVSLALVAPASAQDLRLIEVPRMFPRLNDVRSIASGDLDGDLDLDAVVAAGDGVHVFLGEKGLFEHALGPLPDTNAFGPSEPMRVLVFDVDGDVDLDIFALRSWTKALFLNDGDANFTDASDQVQDTDHLLFFADAAVGDVDGDGDLDVLEVSGHDQYGGDLHRNAGDGFFTAETVPALEGGGAVDLADVDGDGDLDAFFLGTALCDPFAGCSPGLAGLYLNDGAGQFTAAPFGDFEPFESWADRMACGDIDGDGDIDVLYNDTLVLENDGTGAFSEVPDAITGIQNPIRDMHLFDLDGDGDLDLYLSGGPDANSVLFEDVLLENVGGGLVFEDASGRLPASCCSSTTAHADHLDGDGDPDLLVGDAPRTLFLDADGDFVDGSPYQPFASTEAEAIHVGDVDGDGAIDAFHFFDYRLRLLLGDGEGAFAFTDLALPVDSSGVRVIAADIDGDGDLDPYLVRPNWPDTMLRNDAGTLVDVTETQLAPSSPVASDDGLFADVDADGDPDLVVVGYAPFQSSESWLFLNDGEGQLVRASAGDFPTDDGGSTVVAFDANGDGDLDLGVAGGSLLLGDGTGHFTATAWSVSEGAEIEAGDLDGDGYTDLVVRHVLGTVVFWNEAGVITQAQSPLAGQGGIDLADMDEDGDLDVLLASGDWNVNQGNRILTPATFADLPGNVPGALVAVFDMDGDGDQDVVAPGHTLLTNVARQTSWRTLASPGQRLQLEVYGDPGSTYATFWALGSASIPFAPFGTLQLDPFSLSLAFLGTVPGEGKVSTGTTVPSDGSLVGVDVVWQSIVGVTPRFTNRTTTPILSAWQMR